MKINNYINEIFWLRGIACIAVTFGHAIQIGYFHFTQTSSYHAITYLLYMGILFGVPVFVFISEFLLANKYSNGVPKGFLKKRLKILGIPYLFMSIVYSMFEIENWTIKNILLEISSNVFLGTSTVYFVLIIFQFYFLHIFLSKHLNRLSPKRVIPIALLVNVLYLSVFNFIEAPNNAFANYFWNPGYWMPFVGWIFYFVLGYYCGRNYESLKNSLRKYSKWVFLMPVMTLSIMFLFNKYLLIDQSSKRIDMLLFATSMIFLIIYASSFFKKTPKIIMIISNYSFSIFLLNEFFLLIFRTFEPPAYLNIVTYSLLVFFLSLLSSISTSYFMNKFRIGKYLVGSIIQIPIVNKLMSKKSA